MRSSGEGFALAISLTIDHTFCFAVSMTPPIEPERSMQKTTSTRGLSAGTTAAATGAASFGGSIARANGEITRDAAAASANDACGVRMGPPVVVDDRRVGRAW